MQQKYNKMPSSWKGVGVGGRKSDPRHVSTKINWILNNVKGMASEVHSASPPEVHHSSLKAAQVNKPRKLKTGTIQFSNWHEYSKAWK